MDTYVEPNGPGAYGGNADERFATPDEAYRLNAYGFAETKLRTLWIAPPSFGGRFLSVDEALSEVERVATLNA